MSVSEEGRCDEHLLSEVPVEPPPARRLRLLIYTTLFPNSRQQLAGHFVLERMRHLVPFADMTVIAPVPYFPRIRINQRWFDYAGIPHTETYAGFKMGHPRYVVVPRIGMATHGFSMFMGSLPQVWQRLRTTDFDLIDAHYVYPDGLAAILLGRFFGKPVVISARGSDINLFPRFASIRPMVRQVLKRADAVIAVSQPLMDLMVQLGCPADKVTVIENGVDSAKFKPESRPEMRQRLGLPLDRPIVLSVGHLIELKGFHIVIEAISRLKRRRPDILFVIVGEGTYRSSLQKQIQELHLEDNVILAGARAHNELSSWYNAADLFCLASSSEGWPNVVLEAMACGLPVIATRVGSLPEVLSSGLGMVVDRDAQAFERALEKALQFRWDHTSIVQKARAHEWARVGERLLAVYRSVLANRNKSLVASK
jgi:teichuronic acid biosynthesis glycosyltransferase TuaC